MLALPKVESFVRSMVGQLGPRCLSEPRILPSVVSRLIQANHNTLLIGTGEGNLSADSYFGVGVYVVRKATSDTPVLRGPFHLDTNGINVFSARSIVSIQVDPENDNIVFCATVRRRPV